MCRHYSCAVVETFAIPAADWPRLRATFAAAPDAPGERAALKPYIAAMERYIGARNGTDRDIGGTFQGAGRPGQLDCIDEATNTTTYLKLLRNEGLLRFHRVDDLAHRGFFLFGWPHTTAVIREIDGGARFAVDAWFHANGVPPEIVPIETWKAGYDPGD